LVDVFVRGVGKQRRAIGACAVDQHVERPARVGGKRDFSGDGSRIGHIQHQHICLAATRMNGLGQSL
jgi:hypothetical protein